MQIYEYPKNSAVKINTDEWETLEEAVKEHERVLGIIGAVTKVLSFMEEQQGMSIFAASSPEITEFLNDKSVRFGLLDALASANGTLMLKHEEMAETLNQAVKRVTPEKH